MPSPTLEHSRPALEPTTPNPTLEPAPPTTTLEPTPPAGEPSQVLDEVLELHLLFGLDAGAPPTPALESTPHSPTLEPTTPSPTLEHSHPTLETAPPSPALEPAHPIQTALEPTSPCSGTHPHSRTHTPPAAEPRGLTSQVLDEVLELHLALGLDAGAVHVGVEEDDGEGQDEDGVRVAELAQQGRVTHAVALAAGRNTAGPRAGASAPPTATPGAP